MTIMGFLMLAHVVGGMFMFYSGGLYIFHLKLFLLAPAHAPPPQ